MTLRYNKRNLREDVWELQDSFAYLHDCLQENRMTADRYEQEVDAAVARYTDIETILRSLNKNVLNKMRKSKSRLLIKTHIKQLLHQFDIEMDEVGAALREVSHTIPHNVYNIKKALSDFADDLSGHDKYHLINKCYYLKYNIKHYSSCDVSYTSQDIQEAREAGFEEGYRAAQQGIKQQQLQMQALVKRLD